MNTYQMLRQAIIDRKIVRCSYGGYRREVCPHVIGTKNGRKQLLAFQFAGESSSGLPTGGEWRCMKVDGISEVSVQDGPWRTGTGHSRPQTCVDLIDVEVEY
jgi:hypothetical protein